MQNDIPLPDGWVWNNLNNVCEKVQDGIHFSPKVQYQEPGENRFLYITAKNIKENGVTLDDVTFIDRETHIENRKRCDPRKGDVLLIKDGVTTGVATVNEINEEFTLLSSVAQLRPKQQIIDAYYLKHYLNSPIGHQMIIGEMTGTAIKRIILDKIRNSSIPIPPLEDQRLIVVKIEELFTQLDAGTAALRRVQAGLKRYKASVLKAACKGRLVTQDPSDEPAKNILHQSGKVQLLEEDLPSLPDGWCWTTVAELAENVPYAITDGPFGSKLKTEHYTDAGPRVIRLQNIGEGEFRDAKAHISQEHFVTLHRHRIYAGDLVIAGLGELLPRACMIPEYVGEAIVKADCIRFKPNSQIADGKYLLWVLNSEPIRKLVAKIVHGVGRPRMNQQEIKAIPIPLPPLSEQKRIAAEVEQRLSVVTSVEDAVEAGLARSGRLRQAILKRAFCGQL